MNNGLSIQTANKLFSSHRLKPSELATYCLNVAKTSQPHYNVFSNLFPQDEILASAEASDERHKKGQPLSVLDGIPISIKCNIAVKDKPFTASSNFLQNLNGYDSFVASKLRKSGAILMGLCSMDEFGMGSLGDNCNDGFTRNPLPSVLKSLQKDGYYSEELKLHKIKALSLPAYCVEPSHNDVFSSGGSSSGSAASVALGSSLASIGTDTGGSVRLPAAWCGVAGLKPSYGLIPRKGVISYASSLDTIGIIANSANCTRLVLNILRKGDGEESLSDMGDATSYFDPNSLNSDETHLNDNRDDLRGLRIGIPEAFVVQECSLKMLQAWERASNLLKAKGASIQILPDSIISSTDILMSLPAYYVLSSAEASSNLARFDGFKFGVDFYGNDDESNDIIDSLSSREQRIAYNREKGFGVEVKRRILAGTAVLSSDRFHSYYESAANIRASITKQFDDAFADCSGVDLMLIPTTLTDPPNQKDGSIPDRTEAFENDVMTTPISLAGLPSVSIPVGCTESILKKNELNHFPVVGVQIFGPRYSEDLVLRAASAMHSLAIFDDEI